jgi:hypothetical protein
MDEEKALSTIEPREPGIETADPDALTTATVGIVGTILVIVVVVFVQGLYESQHRAEFGRKVVAEAPAELRSLRAAQRTKLQAMGWVDKQNGIVAVPIERAMELLAADPKPAAPIIVPTPPTPPTPPPAPTAAAGVSK